MVSEEQAKYKEELRQERIARQKQKGDYSYYDEVEIERCEDCGAPLNSHGHCPHCDY